MDPETEAINQQVKALRTGEIAYRLPSPMRVNDLQRVTARVGHVLGSNIPELPGTGPLTSTTLPVGPHVRADLTGPDFTISRVGANDEGKRVLADGNFAEWSWDVRPQKSGTLHLDLVVSVLVREGSASLYTQTFARSVEVEVNTWYGLGRWLKDYWPLTGLTVPVMGAGVYAFLRWVRVRRTAAPKLTPPRPARGQAGPSDVPGHWS